MAARRETDKRADEMPAPRDTRFRLGRCKSATKTRETENEIERRRRDGREKKPKLTE